MRYLITISLTFITVFSYSQVTDTLYISNQTVINVHFDSPITNDHFSAQGVQISATKDRKNLVMIARQPYFKDLNLIIETENAFYVFVLSFKTRLTKFFFPYDPSKAIYSKVEEIDDATLLKASQLSQANEQEISFPFDKDTQYEPGPEFRDFTNQELLETAKEVLKATQEYGSLAAKAKKLTCYVPNIFVHGDYLFFKMVLINDSNIPYDIKFTRWYSADNRNVFKNASDSDTDLIPESVLNDEVQYLPSNQSIEKVYVFKKFTLENNQKLYLNIKEKGGFRDLIIRILPEHILNSKPI